MGPVGRQIPRLDSSEIVTGTARYAADIRLPGMLEGVLLYPPLPCARILGIDAGPARSAPGVEAVLTHAEVPGSNSYLYFGQDDQPLFAVDAVRYQGDVVAAAAAVDRAAAIAALAAVEVAYEPLAGVFDPLEAMEPDAPRVWPDRDNVHERLVFGRGDPDAGFAEADVVVEHEYVTQRIEHAFLEPEGAVAAIEPDGTIVVYSATQSPHSDREQIARALAVPENRVRVVTPHIGGGFGGKQEAHVQIHAALLAGATGRPVRVIRSREESIRTHVKRHPIRIRYKTGARRDGRVTAIDVSAIGDTGPYLNAGAEVMSVVAATVSGPYDVPNARIEAVTVLTNNPIGGAMRGFGIPQGTFACERQLDRVAAALEMDPLELRYRNIVDTGNVLPSGARVREGRPLRECLQQAVERSGWSRRVGSEQQPAPHLRRGWGLAAGFKTIGMGRGVPDTAGVQIEMTRDGNVIVRTGAADVGQGAHTALAQIAAAELGVEPDAVRVARPDTDLAPDAGPTCASRVTYVSGNAVLAAAAPVKASLLAAGRLATGGDEGGLVLEGGYLNAGGEQVMTVAEAAAAACAANLPLIGDGSASMEYPEQPPEYAQPHASQVFGFGAQVARVLVDVETGRVDVEELTLVHDAGRVINPGGAIGQLEGAAAMGLGYALIEELHSNDGMIVNDSLESYLIPTAADLPPMRVGIVEIPEPMAPYGAKGVGESSLPLVAPAVANAVADAIGAPIDALPISPERVLEAMAGARR